MWKKKMMSDGGSSIDTMDRLRFFCGSVEEILEQFWDFQPDQKSTIITYNGRSFDGPFLILRSALLDIEPTRNLVPYRYSFEDHCDLAEVISFYGARQMESLDFWRHQAGIESPKQEISEYLGDVFVSQLVDVRFEEVEGNTVCAIKVQPGDEPVFYDEEDFYIRRSSATVRLDDEEKEKYIEKHF